MSVVQTVIKERPILFKDEMVRALLGNLKTQTRREVNLHEFKPSTTPGYDWTWRDRRSLWQDVTTERLFERYCPFKVGQLLWVREGSIQMGHERTGKNGQYLWPKFADPAEGARWFKWNCFYTTDLPYNAPEWDEPHGTLNKMFMPRWASRITLEITDVRVERVREITEEDALAEGCTVSMFSPHVLIVDSQGHSSEVAENFVHGIPKVGDVWLDRKITHVQHIPASIMRSAKENYHALWGSINGYDSWNENVWVWVISFRQIKE